VAAGPSGVVVAGLLLAAGAGRRYGGPKSLARDEDGTPWLTRSVERLLEGGCARVVVVLGAGGEEAERLLAQAGSSVWAHVGVVHAPTWHEGMSASLRTGLTALAKAPESVLAALVQLVDLPDVGASVVSRVLADTAGPGDLARAAFDGRPGHPVLIGRDHWDAIVEGATGDRGARDHLTRHPHRLVECGDLAQGSDRDHR
jgi:CTP:molybdopterin cytidylyltransferase MocA